MVTLATAVGALDNVLALSASTTAAAGDRFGLDDEMVEFVQYEISAGTNKRIRQAKTENKARWLVYRGVGTTTAAAHASGTTLLGAAEAFVVSDDTTEPSPIPAGGGASDAASVTYDNAESGLTAEDVQAALDEVAAGGATPTLAEVLAAGNDVGATGQIVHVDGSIEVIAGAAGEDVDAATLSLASGAVGEGGIAYLKGGDGTANNPGGAAELTGGYGDDVESTGGLLRALAGLGNGAGGGVQATGGAAGSGSGADGGDITLTAGAGDGAGRAGLVFLNLPTANPVVAGALWADTGVVKVSAG